MRLFPSQLCCLCQSLQFTMRSWSENSKQSACCFGTNSSGKRSCTNDANGALVAHCSAVSPLVLPSPVPFRSKAQIPHDPTRLTETWHRMGPLSGRTAPPQVNPKLHRAMVNPLCVLEGCVRGECGLCSSWSQSASQRACERLVSPLDHVSTSARMFIIFFTASSLASPSLSECTERRIVTCGLPRMKPAPATCGSRP